MNDRFTLDRGGSTGQVVNEETMFVLITSPDPRNENVLWNRPGANQDPYSSDRISETRGRARYKRGVMV